MEGLADSYPRASDIRERYNRLKEIKSVPECIALRDDVNDWIKYMAQNNDGCCVAGFVYIEKIEDHLKHLLFTGPNGNSIRRFYHARFFKTAIGVSMINLDWLSFQRVVHDLCISTQPAGHDLPYPFKLIDWAFNTYGQNVYLTICKWIDSQIRQMGPALLTLSETIRYQLNCRHEPWPEA